MTKQTVEMGASAPLVLGGGVTVPAHWRDAGSGRAAPLRVSLGVGEDSIANGHALMDRVRHAVAAVTRKGTVNESAVRELRRLVADLWSIVRVVPQFIEYMNWLATKDLAAAHRILTATPQRAGDGRARGRPTESNDYLVAMVDLVKTQEGGSVALACKRLLDEIRPSPFACRFATVAAMATAYSQHHERVHAARDVVIRPEELARVPYVLRD